MQKNLRKKLLQNVCTVEITPTILNFVIALVLLVTITLLNLNVLDNIKYALHVAVNTVEESFVLMLVILID